MKVLIASLLLMASAYCGAQTTSSTTATVKHDDWPQFYRQVQLQVFQLEASLHELTTRILEHTTADEHLLLTRVLARDVASVETILKEVEAEGKKELTASQTTFINTTVTQLEHFRTELTKLHEFLAAMEHHQQSSTAHH